MKKAGHYLGAHSDQHLLYCDWSKRDSLLVTEEQFRQDLHHNYQAMQEAGISRPGAPYFLPPYEWYNDTIAAWTRKEGLHLINFTPGTLSTADYTTPQMKNYRSSDAILASIKQLEQRSASGLNGFILLLHIGTDPQRIDKMYAKLDELLTWLSQKRYKPVRVDWLLQVHK